MRHGEVWFAAPPGQSGCHTPGFKLDLERGYCARNQADSRDQDDAVTLAQVRRVVPYVRDTKNVLVMKFDQRRPGPEMTGLQAAFKQAIQLHFQIESRELAREALPEMRDRREILFSEAAEGTTQALIERGYIVIRFHHTDDWEAIFRRHPDVFGMPDV